jgi:hypothetical protein
MAALISKCAGHTAASRIENLALETGVAQDIFFTFKIENALVMAVAV